MENEKKDREIIVDTLRFIKENREDNKNYTNPKDSPEFSELPEPTQNRIRDIMVVNRFASMPNPGKEWELAITWHPEGGVDLLNRRNIKNVLNEDGSFNFWYKSLAQMKKQLTTIIVSVIGGVIGGIILIWIAPKFSKQETEILEHPTQNYDNKSGNTDDMIEITDSLAIDSLSEANVKLE